MGKKKKYEKIIDTIASEAADVVCNHIIETGDMGVGLAYIVIMDAINDAGKAVGKDNAVEATIMIGEMCAKAKGAREKVK